MSGPIKDPITGETFALQPYAQTLTDEEFIHYLDDTDPVQARCQQMLLVAPSEEELAENWIELEEVATQLTNLVELVDELEQLATGEIYDLGLNEAAKDMLLEMVADFRNIIINLPEAS